MNGRGRGALGQFKMVEGGGSLKKFENHWYRPLKGRDCSVTYQDSV